MNAILTLLGLILLNGFLLGVPLLTLWTTRLATRSQFGGDFQLTRWLSWFVAVTWLLLPFVLFASQVELRRNAEQQLVFWMVVPPLLLLIVLQALSVWLLLRAVRRWQPAADDQRRVVSQLTTLGTVLLIVVPPMFFLCTQVEVAWTQDRTDASLALAPVLFGISALQALCVWKLSASLGPLEPAPQRTRHWVAVLTYACSWIVLVLVTVIMGYPWLLLPLAFVLCMYFANGYPARFEARQMLLLNTLQRANGAPEQVAASLVASSEMLGPRLQQRFLPLLDGERFGTPVTFELAQAGLLSPQLRVPLEIAESTGTLRESLDLVKQLPLTLWPEDRSRIAATSMCLVLTLLTLTVLGVFLLYFPVPRLQHIWADYGMGQSLSLEASLRVMVEISTPVLLLCLVVYVYQLTQPQQGGLLFTLERWFSVRPFVPGILSSLRSAVLGRQELPGVLATLAEDYRGTRIGPVLAQLDDAARAGLPVWQEMSRLRLITPDEASALSSAERLGNLPNTLWLLADGRLSRRRNSLVRWFEFLRPIAYVALGLLIFWVQFSLFSSLTSLISALA